MHPFRISAALGLMLACLPAFAQAQPQANAADYPNRPVRILVAGPPGSSNDITMRAMAQRFTQAWGQQMVLDNRPGGAGLLAHEITVRANPDGYTLVFSSSSGMVLNPLLFKMPYDPFRDFAPISLGSINPQLLFANPSVAAKSAPELIALAKAKPGTLNCASAGNGTPNHLGCELLKSMGNISFVHVPYKGSAPGVVDVVAGQAHFMFASIPQVLPLVRTGKLRALGVGSVKRTSVMPDVAAISEALPGFEYENWYAMLAPAGTPAPIVQKINAEMVRMIDDPAFAKRLQELGAEPRSSTPAGLTAHMRKEWERWAGVINSAGIKVER